MYFKAGFGVLYQSCGYPLKCLVFQVSKIIQHCVSASTRPHVVFSNQTRLIFLCFYIILAFILHRRQIFLIKPSLEFQSAELQLLFRIHAAHNILLVCCYYRFYGTMNNFVRHARRFHGSSLLY